MYFSQTELKQLANNQSFQRGKDYYQSGAVKNIICEELHFEAVVTGSDRYHVSLDIDDGELDFDCDCPYNFDGICKHCVALGLAILDGKAKASKTASKTKESESFSDCYQRTEDKIKLEFLEQILKKDAVMQKQFIAYAPAKHETIKSETEEDAVDIKTLADEIFEEITELDFDEAAQNDHSYYSYGYDDEGDDVVDIIQTVLKPVFKVAQEKLSEGNLLDAFKLLLAMYEGTQNLPEPDDEYGAFADGLNSELQAIIFTYIKEFANKTDQTTFSLEKIKSTIDFYFKHATQSNAKLRSQLRKAPTYSISDFSSVFMSLLVDAEIAEYLSAQIEKHQLSCSGFTLVQMKMADLTGNSSLWFELAEKSDNDSVIHLLLERYRETHQPDNFHRIAKEAFGKRPSHFDEYLYENLDKENHTELYLAVLESLAKRTYKLKFYKELRPYYSEDEKNKFIRYVSNSFMTELYIEVLELEERYDEILAFVRKNKVNEKLDKFIRPILNIYPDECYAILSERVKQYLNSSGRNRSTYQIMVGLMSLMQKINGKEQDAAAFLIILFANKLPALKDEMLKAGLVKK